MKAASGGIMRLETALTFCGFWRIMRETKESDPVKWFIIGAIALAVIFIALEIRDQILLRKIKKKEQEEVEETLKNMRRRK
jgi:uncharacterized membrane protein